jgi:hypothetical protein
MYISMKKKDRLQERGLKMPWWYIEEEENGIRIG